MKFSVIIPCYNQAHFLKECYDSLITQQYDNWEAIFVNDGSTDETQKLLTDFAEADNRIRMFNKENGGLSSARNLGINQVTGDYVFFLDADDLLLPNCISTVYKTVIEKPAIRMIQMGYRHISQDGKTVYRTVGIKTKNSLLPTILFDNIGPPVSICMNTNTIKQVGYFDETLNSCEDWDYWMRAAFVVTKIEIINTPLVDYRMNENSMSRNSFTMYAALKQVLLRGKLLFETNLIDKKAISADEEFKSALKAKLALCLGVSVMQNKIDESIKLYKSEVASHNLIYQPNDFKPMSSYLTFRYRSSSIEIESLFKNTLPLFEMFFSRLPYTKKRINKCINIVFANQYHHYYKHRLGKLGLLLFKIKMILN